MIGFTLSRLLCGWMCHIATEILGDTAEAALFMADAMEEIGEFFE